MSAPLLIALAAAASLSLAAAVVCAFVALDERRARRGAERAGPREGGPSDSVVGETLLRLEAGDGDDPRFFLLPNHRVS